MDNADLTRKVVEILARVSGKPANTIDGESRLIQDLELDSINFIELDHEIRENGLATIPEAELRGIANVGDVVRLVSNHLTVRPTAP